MAGPSRDLAHDAPVAEIEKERREAMVDDLFRGGTMVYCGYVDDPRNTDNAWMETTAVHFHCNAMQAAEINLSAGDDAAKAIWLDVDPVQESRYTNLYASARPSPHAHTHGHMILRPPHGNQQDAYS